MSDNYLDQDQSGFAAGFLLGLVIGGAGGYFLTTESGRKLLSSLTSSLGEQFDNLKDSEAIQSLLAKLQELPTLKETELNTKAKINELASRVADATAPKKTPPLRRLFHSGGSPLKP